MPPKKKPLKKTKPRLPLWDWTTTGLTQSALTKWLSCREQFALEFIEGYTPKGFSVPLEFGSVIHFALERQDEIKSLKGAERLIKEVCASYHDTRSKQILSKHDQLTMSKTLAAAEATFPLYYATVREDDLKQNWVEHEQLFRVPYEFALVDRTQSAKIDLRGMRDKAYRTKSKGLLGLFETKTKSQIDDNQIQDGLRADLQAMFYLFTMKLEFGENPKELLYNIIRRPGQQIKDSESYTDYKSRIQRDIKKRPDYYFRRWEVNVLSSDLDTFQQKVLDPALAIMRQWWESVEGRPFDRFKSPYHFVNLPALFTKYGTAPMFKLMVLGKVKDYYIRSSVFPELALAV